MVDKRSALRTRVFCGLLIVGLVAGAAYGTEDHGKQVIGAIDRRVVAMLYRIAPAVDYDAVREYERTQQPDGSWADINYQSQQEAGWTPGTLHLEQRLKTMALAWGEEGGPLQGDADLLNHIERGLNYWLAYNFDHPLWCPNWWYNDIFIPRLLGQIGILTQSALDPAIRAKLVERVSWAKPEGTGANWIWLCEAALYHGLLAGDIDKVSTQFENIFQDLRRVGDEGVQPDWSFFQHGPQQQMGAYGLAYPQTIAPWLWVATGTEFAPAQRRVVFLRNYLLNGQAWCVQKGRYDLNSTGRTIVTAEHKVAVLAETLDFMVEADPAARPQYEAILKSIREPDAPNATLGNRWYPYAVCMVHRRPDWSASLRMVSAGLLPNELVNDDSVLGGLIGVGSMFQYVDAGDYTGIPEVWDWRRIPGTTAGRDKGAIVPGSPRNVSNFAGGVSDGEVGAAAMIMNPLDTQPIAWRKSWFFFDDAYVCLGQVTGSDLDDNVLTTLAQETLDAKPELLAGKRGLRLTASESDVTLSEPSAIVHGQSAYIFPKGTALALHAGPETGNWYRAYPKPEEVQLKEKKTRDVFMLAISHGSHADTNPAIQCVVFPVHGEKNAHAFLRRPWIRVVANSTTVQAVYNEKTDVLLAAFFKPGRIAAHGLDIEAKAPAMLLLKQRGHSWEALVTDPTGTEEATPIAVSGKCDGATVTFQPNYAGTERMHRWLDEIHGNGLLWTGRLLPDGADGPAIALNNILPLDTEVDISPWTYGGVTVTPTRKSVTIPAGETGYMPVAVAGLEAVPRERVSIIPFDVSAQTVSGDADWPKVRGSLALDGPFVPQIVDHPCLVDGKLDDWPPLRFSVPAPTQMRAHATTWSGPADASWNMDLALHGGTLYVAVEVKDDKVVRNDTGRPWLQDAVEMRLVAVPEDRQRTWHGQDELGATLLIAASPKTAEAPLLVWEPGKLSDGVRVASVQTETGYTFEAAVPVSWLNAQSGGDWKSFRFNVAVDDWDDDPNAAQLWWRPDWRTDATYDNSGKFVRP